MNNADRIFFLTMCMSEAQMSGSEWRERRENSDNVKHIMECQRMLEALRDDFFDLNGEIVALGGESPIDG